MNATLPPPTEDNTPIQPKTDGELMNFDRIWERRAFEMEKSDDSSHISDIIVGGGESASICVRAYAEEANPGIMYGIHKGSKLSDLEVGKPTVSRESYCYPGECTPKRAMWSGRPEGRLL